MPDIIIIYIHVLLSDFEAISGHSFTNINYNILYKTLNIFLIIAEMGILITCGNQKLPTATIMNLLGLLN